MKFMCELCRKHLSADPGRANQFWLKAWNKAQCYEQQGHWDSAITCYGNALDAADLLLAQKSQLKEDFERYLLTAQELTYVLRKGGYFKDLEWFVKTVELRMQEEVSITNKARFVRSIRDVANSPICAVDLWMKTLTEKMTWLYPVSVH